MRLHAKDLKEENLEHRVALAMHNTILEGKKLINSLHTLPEEFIADITRNKRLEEDLEERIHTYRKSQDILNKLKSGFTNPCEEVGVCICDLGQAKPYTRGCVADDTLIMPANYPPTPMGKISNDKITIPLHP